MNKLFFSFSILFISIFMMSCSSPVATETLPPPIDPPTETFYKIVADLSIEEGATNDFNDSGTSYSLGTIDDAEPPSEDIIPITSPIMVVFGDKVHTLEDLERGIEFSNTSTIKVIINVNDGYNIYVGGPFEDLLISNKNSTMSFEITNDIGLVINVPKKGEAITSTKLKARKYGRGSLYVSGNEITDSEEHTFTFPLKHRAKLLSEPVKDDGIIYSRILFDGTTTTTNHYPLNREESILMDYDKSVTFRYGRENKAWDGYTSEEPIFAYNALHNKVVHEIYNAYELFGVAKRLNNDGYDYKDEIVELMTDINLNNRNFYGIARKSVKAFSGAFNGNGKIIENLRISYDTSASSAGFIANLSGGAISNLAIYGLVEAINGDVGGVIGVADLATILNVTNYVYVTSSRTSSSTGGLVGTMNGGMIENSANFGMVSGTANTGGIVGRTTTGASIKRSYNVTNVNATTLVGGIVGNNSDSTVQVVYNLGEINATGDYVGGIMGRNDNGTSSSAYNTGNVSGNNYVGGIEGYRKMVGDLATVYSIGKITARGQYIGGIVGFYAQKNVSANDFTGAWFIKDSSINASIDITYPSAIFTLYDSGDLAAGGFAGLMYTVDEAAWVKGDSLPQINGVTARPLITGLGEGDYR